MFPCPTIEKYEALKDVLYNINRCIFEIGLLDEEILKFYKNSKEYGYKIDDRYTTQYGIMKQSLHSFTVFKELVMKDQSAVKQKIEEMGLTYEC